MRAGLLALRVLEGDSPRHLLAHLSRTGVVARTLEDENPKQVLKKASSVKAGEQALAATFIKAYIDAAFWATTDDDGTAFDARYHVDDLAPETRRQINEDCAAFYTAHYELIKDRLERAGHDFFLTRNGHGAGFWDGDWEEPAATVLDEASRAFGSFEMYVGDDGKIYA